MSFLTSFKKKILGKRKYTKEVDMDLNLTSKEKQEKNEKTIENFETKRISKHVNKDEQFKKLFPRDINSFEAVGARGEKVRISMDGKLTDNPNTWQNTIPPEMMNVLSQYFIGYQACALLQQNWIIDRACSVPAEDSISSGYEITLHDDNDGSENDEKSIKLLKDMKHDSDTEFNVLDVCKQAILKMKVFGYSIVVPVFDDDEIDMSEPYNIDGLKGKKYIGMKVIEPYWIMPSFDAESIGDPASASFYVPTWYNIAGSKKIHKSWVIRLVNSEVSDLLKPTYYYGGLPLTQQIYERAYSAERIANEIPLIVTTKRLRVMGVNMNQVASNPSYYEDMMRNITYFLDNFSVAMVDNTSTVTQLDTSVGELEGVLKTSYELIASVAKMPVTKLLKTQPHGMNSAGNYELEDYKNELKALQQNNLEKILQRHFQIYSKCVLGMDIELNIIFNPYESPSERDLADTNAVKASTYNALISSGIVSQEEVRTILRNDEQSGFTELEEKSAEDMENEFNKTEESEFEDEDENEFEK